MGTIDEERYADADPGAMRAKTSGSKRAMKSIFIDVRQGIIRGRTYIVQCGDPFRVRRFVNNTSKPFT